MDKDEIEENQGNKSAFMQENNENTIEVKESLLDKIKNVFKPTPKALPGDGPIKIKKTNMSFETFYRIQDMKEAISSAFENFSNGFSKLLKPKEPKITNGLKTVAIGKDGEVTLKDADVKNGEDAERAGTEDAPIKNIIILGQTRSKPVQAKPSLEVTDLAVDIDKDAKDLDENNIDEKSLEESNSSTTPTQTTTISGIETGTINYNTPAKDSKEVREDESFEK